MKCYTLCLHHKQGDDFGEHVEGLRSIKDAFTAWSKSFRENDQICLQLANMFSGVDSSDVEVEAEDRLIAFTPMTKKGKDLLDAAVLEGLLDAMDMSIDAVLERLKGETLHTAGNGGWSTKQAEPEIEQIKARIVPAHGSLPEEIFLSVKITETSWKKEYGIIYRDKLWLEELRAALYSVGFERADEVDYTELGEQDYHTVQLLVGQW